MPAAVDQATKVLHFVMPFVEGGDLYQLIKEKNDFSEDQVRINAIQIIDAMINLHLQNICGLFS